MDTLEGKKVVVTGGSRGLGLGIVEALVARKAQVTVVARDPGRLDEVAKRLGVDVVRGDVTDENLAHGVLADVRPSVLVLNMVRRRRWDFTAQLGEFQPGVGRRRQANFHWVQEALRLPLPRGTAVIIASAGRR
jgi:NAD(P)-dependent dehydrogenase (short-subunit alcohol dehydrogenase family)